MRLYLYAVCAALLVWYCRRYWLTPWGRYVRHTETKVGGVFMTVKHVRWYPPFLDFERTFHRANGYSYWIEESTGWQPSDSSELTPGYQSSLDGMYTIAKARLAETEELLAPTKVTRGQL